ncbi:hypothetical protein [Roseomonas indoligenes]|uniref:Methyl-accepting chemotaxis protein n=1 Tax=Roseomonas indoligenes TaxID=2820811 RepID=A0A940MZL0_9PROT|nr:hypothetical protein [Pararoseomonas indoligenes]MBP0494072.1 hypothetical protein [Pararoseomonas indoligenes]
MIRSLSDWPIAARLHLCTLMAVLGLVGIAACEIRARSVELEQHRAEGLRAVVEGAATREIAASVQDVSRATEEATAAMREVAGLTDRAGKGSGTVSAAAEAVSGAATAIQREVDGFPQAMRREEGKDVTVLAA